MRRKLKQTKDGYNLMESEIRDAMKHTQSNMAAAKYLNVNYYTYRKYARMYSDPDGRNLFDVHKNQEGRGLKYKSRKGYKTKYPIEEDFFVSSSNVIPSVVIPLGWYLILSL